MNECAKDNTPLLLKLLGLVALATYTAFFWQSLSRFWFSPDWITDDAMQQIYAFHEVQIPGLFKGDVITESMLGYLPPLHYWLCYGLTWITGDPIMMSHWAMFIQLALTVLFIFLAVKKLGGIFPASLAALWFLHSRHLVQRLTGGLPRGWLAPFVAAYIYLILSERHKTILFLILLACGFNPLAAFLTIMAYGATLSWRMMFRDSRNSTLRPFALFILACPVYLAVTYFSIDRSDRIGRMFTYEEALQMPELSRQGGRFQIAPLPLARGEIARYGSQVFILEFYKGIKVVQRNAHYIIASIFLLLLLISWRRKKLLIAPELLLFLAATLFAYFLARLFAFQLYIPSRYLRLPLGIFIICAFSAGIWNAFKFDNSDSSVKNYLPPVIATLVLAALVYAGSGSGLLKQASFNYQKGQYGHSFEWIAKNTSLNTVIAGQPNFMDSVPLFAKRRVYISNETAHPFYNIYYAEVKRRLDISLRAHYAKTLRELVKTIGEENIDFFVFERSRFYPESLAKAEYFAPFDELLRSLTVGDPNQYAYRELPDEPNSEIYPFLVFKDKFAAIIDMKKLKKHFESEVDAN